MPLFFHVCRISLTVTGNHKELVFLRKLVHFDIGKGGNDLVFGGKLGALLEFEVANGTRQRQIAVDSAKVDETASGCDSVLLRCKTARGTQSVLPIYILT